jgi:hypothetical protein
MLMDSGDSDVEIEEEWEEVLLPQLPAVPAAGRGDITIYLNGEHVQMQLSAPSWRLMGSCNVKYLTLQQLSKTVA